MSILRVRAEAFVTFRVSLEIEMLRAYGAGDRRYQQPGCWPTMVAPLPDTTWSASVSDDCRA